MDRGIEGIRAGVGSDEIAALFPAAEEEIVITETGPKVLTLFPAQTCSSPTPTDSGTLAPAGTRDLGHGRTLLLMACGNSNIGKK
jgi:hypothetical protein